MKSFLLASIVVALVSFSACGGGSIGGNTNPPPPPTFLIGGTVTGLTAGGLVLQNNGKDDLSISANGNFQFVTPVSAYSVTVSSQPNGQTCTVASGTGTATAVVTTVAVTCGAQVNETISIVVSGLVAGNDGMQIENNGVNPLPVNNNGTFQLTVVEGSPYAITVSTQPLGATCTVAGGTGTANSNVTVTITCTQSTGTNVTISVVVSGLTGSMTGLTLENNGNSSNPLPVNGNGTFPLTVAAGSPYAITVLAQPTGGTCTVTNGSGTANTNVTVTVTCSAGATTFTIGGTVSGLTGTGLILQNNGGNSLSVTANGTFTFTTAVNSGAAYAVTVQTQPTGQTCSVTNGTGTATANVTNVTVTCSASTFTIGGSVSGLTGTGLVLQNNGGNNLSVTANGTFTFTTALSSGTAYSVTVQTQPTGQTCSVSNGTGTATANVTNVTVTCSAVTFTIGGTVSGLTGTGLVLQNNGANDLSVTANGSFTFTTAVSSGSAYAVTVKTGPTGQSCSIANGTGTANANVTNVTVTCSASTFTIGGTVSGLTGTGLVLQNNGGNNLSVTANGSFTFSTAINSGTTYAVTVKTQPTGQTCAVTNGSGTANADVTNVGVACSASTVTIGGSVSGLTGTGLVLENNGGDSLSITANGSFTFSTAVTTGSAYAVTVLTQPTGQTCTVTNGSGTANANVTNVTVACSAATFTIGGTVSGLTGTGLVLQNNGGNNLSVTANGSFTFTTAVTTGSTYSVTVKTQPTGQTCTVTNGSGTATANVTNVGVACSGSSFTLGVATSGLTGTLVVQDDQTDSLSFNTNTTKTFASTYTSGSTYSVSIVTQPSGQTCTLGSNASGTITANTTVTATCVASGGGNTLSITVTGLTGSVEFTNDLGNVLTFSANGTKPFATGYTNGATYTVYVSSQPATKSCIPTYSTGTISSDVTINAACATGSTRALGTVTGVQPVTCSGGIKNGVCQQMTVSCPGVPDVLAFVKTNTPSGSSLGTATYGTGTDGNGLYESIFTFGSTAVGNVLAAGFTTVQISWGTPFNSTQPNGWVEGPGGVLAAACRYATVTQWIYDNIHINTTLPYCATANSGGSGALAYALSQYPTGNILSMAEVTSGPPTGRLDWGCGCTKGKVAVQCGSAPTLGTCFGVADAPVWDPAYDPNASTGVCSAAVNGTLPPGGLNFFLGDSVEAPGAAYSLPKTHVNLVFGSADNSSAIPIGQDWFDNITSTKSQACVPGGVHSLADTSAGALQIANDIINLCQIQ